MSDNGKNGTPPPDASAAPSAAAGSSPDGDALRQRTPKPLLTLGRKQKGMYQILEARMGEDMLRKLDHPEWLENFAKVMQMQTGVEMTPMRTGVINRARLAAEYILLLRADIRKLTHDLDLAMVEIDRQKNELTRHDGGEDT